MQKSSTSYILADINLIICEDDVKCNSLLDRAPNCLKQIIVFKDIKPATIQRAKTRGVAIHRFCDIETLGAKFNHEDVVCDFSKRF